MEPVWALGLMTGTVLDGNIDIALIRTDGEEDQEFGELDAVSLSAGARAFAPSLNGDRATGPSRVRSLRSSPRPKMH